MLYFESVIMPLLTISYLSIGRESASRSYHVQIMQISESFFKTASVSYEQKSCVTKIVLKLFNTGSIPLFLLLLASTLVGGRGGSAGGVSVLVGGGGPGSSAHAYCAEPGLHVQATWYWNRRQLILSFYLKCTYEWSFRVLFYDHFHQSLIIVSILSNIH